MSTTYSSPLNNTFINGLGLALSLTLNTTAVKVGHGVNVTAELTNTKPLNTSVDSNYSLFLTKLRLFQSYDTCAAQPILELVAFGHYTLDNISAAKPIRYYTNTPPGGGGVAGCGGVHVDSYKFAPNGDKYTYYHDNGQDGCSGSGWCLTARVRFVVDTTWAISSSAAVGSINPAWVQGPAGFLELQPGTYTAALADQWGDMVFLYFQVVTSG